MKNSHPYFLVYKKKYIESLLTRKNFSSKIAYKVKDENINGGDYENIQKLFKWAKAKGGIYDIFQIKYLDLNNRYVTAKSSIKVFL